MNTYKNIFAVLIGILFFITTGFHNTKNMYNVNKEFQNYDTLLPIEIAQKFMSNDSFPDLKNYLCCEMLVDTSIYSDIPKEQLQEFKKMWEVYHPDFSEITLGQRIPKEIKRKFEILQSDNAFAAISVEIYSQKPHNLYLNFIKTNVWKLSSIRDLARSTMMHSRLATTSDSVLSAFFIEHEKDFEALLNSLDKGLDSPEVKKLQEKLEIASIEKATKISIHSVRFIIDGMLNDTFGVLYIDNEGLCPKIDGENYIMIKKIKENWYIFKTT
jgi:hypothetical protein